MALEQSLGACILMREHEVGGGREEGERRGAEWHKALNQPPVIPPPARSSHPSQTNWEPCIQTEEPMGAMLIPSHASVPTNTQEKSNHSEHV